MILDTYLYTNQGSREENEDSAFFRIEDNHGIFLVADGLGGHRYGKLASECVVSSLTDAWLPEDMPNRNAWLNQQIETANEKLLQLQNEYQSKMKSTLVVLTVDKEKAFWAHVGDSRLYYFHNYSPQATTADHSVSYKKYKAGEITKAQINTDEDQSCLLRSLGGTEHWNPDIGEGTEGLQPGDGFLLCSDGVWEYLYDEEILIDLLKAETAREWAELLLLRVISRIPPENDNLSLLTVLLQ